MKPLSGKPTESIVASGGMSTPPSQPEASSAAAAIRAIAQPKRRLYRFLSSQFASGALKAGGRVILRSGPSKEAGTPSVSALMRGRV